MDSSVALLASAFAAPLLIALVVLGIRKGAVAAFLFSAAVLPITLLQWSPDHLRFTGIADSSLSLTTYGLSLVLLVFAFARNHGRQGWLQGYCLAVTAYLLVGLLTVWSGTEAQWSGALHWILACMALLGGLQFGLQLSSDIFRLAVACILVIFVLNAALCVAQLAGFDWSLYPAQLADNLLDRRPIGTFSHPSTLGKFVLLSLIFLLPALRSTDGPTRLMSVCAVGLAIPLVAVTLARANLAAVVIALLFWMFLDRRSSAKRPIRLVLLFVSLAFSAPVIAATTGRFATDPGGGDRAQIYQTGLLQLQKNFMTGTGPNYYVQTVGRWDQMTAWGYPLHNSFLYPIAELGAIGGVLVILPIFVIGGIALIDYFAGGRSLWSKAYLVTFPGVIAIAMTGWGMLIGSTLLLWFFAAGACAGGIMRHKRELLSPEKHVNEFHERSSTALSGGS